MIEQRKSLGVVLEHRSLLELSLSIEKSLSCVIEQLVIRHYILVELSLEVQGGQNYFWFVEGTCIIACVLSFSILLLLSATLRLWTQVRLWTISDSESGNSFSERKKEKFLKTQFNPPNWVNISWCVLFLFSLYLLHVVLCFSLWFLD